MKKFKQFLTILLFSNMWIHVQSQYALPNAEVNRIDSIMNQLMTKYNITGSSIAIVDNNQIAYAKGYGFSDKKNKVAANENTIYNIASITKTFTALAIMKLYEEKKIDLNKSAKDYLPELKMNSLVENGDILKIKNLLTHTSGLPDDIKNGMMCNEVISFWTVIEELNKQVLTQPANLKMNYSNIGYDLLGLIIERVSGKKYEDYIRENILNTLSMTNTSFEQKHDDPHYSKAYLKDSTETDNPKIRDVPTGGLFSNALDMSKFMMLLLNDSLSGNNQIVNSSTLQEMKTDHLSDVLLNCNAKFGYGLFIEKMRFAEDSIIGEFFGHAGDFNHHSTMFIVPKMNIGFIIISNSEKGHSFCNTALVKLSNEYIQEVKGIKLHRATNLAWSSKSVKNNITDYHELIGRYNSGGDSFLELKGGNTKKLTLVQGKYKMRLKKYDDSTNSYSITLLLLKLIPIKLKGTRFAFEKIGDNIFLKELDEGSKTAEYISVRDKSIPISEEWKNAVGKYKVTNEYKGNLQGVPTELNIINNKIVLTVNFPTLDVSEGYSFDQISDTIAAVDGIDRGCGMIMKILPNGHLYFSGYELEKQIDNKK